jgi:sterol 3beta-glucosyltransferase
VWELGAGAKPISRKKLTVERLSQAINMALTQPIQAKASELGQKIQAEDGAGTAVRIILDCFG